MHEGLVRLPGRQPGDRRVVLSDFGRSFPAAYRGALFFSDRLRDCIYALLPGTNGLPQRGKVVLFAAGAMRPMDIEVLPGGDLLYVDQDSYQVQRISYKVMRRTRSPRRSRRRA